jgi:transposase
MARRRRTFTAEFNTETVGLAASGRSVSAAARALHVGADVRRRWRRQYAAAAGGAARAVAVAREVFPWNGKLTSQDEEIRQLRRRVAQLEAECDILKKATGGLTGRRRPLVGESARRGNQNSTSA